MEYIFVAFDPKDRRDVIANGNVVGSTDNEIMLPADFYRIELSGTGFAPPFWEGPISGTTPAEPLKIAFSHA